MERLWNREYVLWQNAKADLFIPLFTFNVVVSLY